jgi:phospholipase C
MEYRVTERCEARPTRNRNGGLRLGSVCVLCLVGMMAGLHGCGGGGGKTVVSPSSGGGGEIGHVVVIVQENRTPDNLFHGLPNADIADSGMNSAGENITLTPIPLSVPFDLDHGHNAFVKMYDGGKMDGADKLAAGCTSKPAECPPPNTPFNYVNPAEVQPYFDMAEQYTFADRMFQTNQGPSFPAHQFVIAGTSAPTATSDLFAAENVGFPANAGSTMEAGCAGPTGETVAMIDPMGTESTTQFPCFEHQTLVDLLDSHGITWRYYAPSTGSIWTAPNAIHHLRWSSDWQNVIIPQSKVLTDIANGQLAQVTWVIPDGRASDHPRQNEGTGPSWVASIVNEIGNSAYWADTAILITWDDWGGWYDHVSPPILNSYEYGFRVPLIVVSPYAKKGYVSHAMHDFGSLLRFTEETFHLPSLGYADSRADDLSDCFDFNQTPTTFQSFAAKYDASYFLHDTRRPVDPDDD